MHDERILVLGNVNVDLVMGEVDAWPAVGTEVILPRSEMRAGGSAGNTALALTGLGIPHRMIAAIGQDVMGDWLASQFDPDRSTWITMDCSTTITVGIVHTGGDRAFFTTTGHLHRSRLDDLVQRLPRAPGANCHAIVSGGFLIPEVEAGTLDLLAALRDRGWITAIDPGWPTTGWTASNRTAVLAWIEAADMTLLNAEEVMGLAGSDELEGAISMIVSGAARRSMLVVKRGQDGVRIIAGGVDVAEPAPVVAVVDTVGAGDTFNAGFLAALAQGRDIRSAARAGVSAASAAISTYPRRYALPA